MATPANLTYAQIETRVANHLRIPTTNTTEMTKIAALINEVYRDLCIKFDWWFLDKRTVINTYDDYNTGTALVGSTGVGTQMSTGVTLSSAPSTGYGSFAGWMFQVLGNDDANAIYRVASHTAGATALVLDAGYTGDYSTASGFRLYRDTYDLPADVMKVRKVKRYGKQQPLEPIGWMEMADFKTRAGTHAGPPEFWTVQEFATTGDPTSARQLIVFPFPDDTYRLEITYKQQLNTELSSTTQPLIPDEYRQIIIYGALARGYPIFLADVERGSYFQGVFNDMLNLMTAAHREYAQDYPGIRPRGVRPYWQHRRRGRVSLGSYFDILPRDPV